MSVFDRFRLTGKRLFITGTTSLYAAYVTANGSKLG